LGIPLRFARWWSINTNPERSDFAPWILAGCFSLSLCLATGLLAADQLDVPEPPNAAQAEFSATLVKRVAGRSLEAQVYAKSDRLRLEYKYAVRTDLGYSSIEIIRLDRGESWFLLAQRRQILSVPVKSDDILPIQPSLPGEKSRILVGDAATIGRPSKLYEVRVDYNGRNERFYQWVDVETGVVLKLVSQDREWSVEYLRIRFSPQPANYFDEPTGYRRWVPPSTSQERG
jgi:hypothetical protein